jgi:hypothetical protein
LIRAESFSRISRSAMLRRATALYIRTGTFSSPKLMEPDQIALAMAGIVPVFALAVLNAGADGQEVARS